ncbi:MAG: flagellin [Schwartzia sp.]|nr:flagellin [Schwartzia sp. (in: firmicutes)]
MEAVQQSDPNKNLGIIDVDLKTLREAVASGQTIADAFISTMLGISQLTIYTGDSSNPTAPKLSDTSDAGAGTKSLTISAYNKGTSGNSETISISETKLSQYTIDFKSYFESTNPKIPEDLVGKGFRVYCATCPDQWVNFHFIDGSDPGEADRPPSGSSGADIMTVRVDIIDLAHVTDLDSFIEAVRVQAGEAIKHIRDGHKHMLNVAGDVEKGTVTIYDERNFDVFDRASVYPDLQEKGAKLADGIMDDVLKMERGVYVKDLVIQHTDHASQNIHVKIPQTTLDHLFNYIEGATSISEYNVMTAESREKLLGNMAGTRRTGGYAAKEEKGALDTALEYLTGANTLVGAQIMRLGMTEQNIVTSRESTTTSESTIRDADMAKEMTEYTKANVLLQAAQSMLAQANQNSSQVISLLQ